MDSPKLTLKQLHYLLAIEEQRHFRRAAERCGVSQPSLSAQLQTLEDALGVKLVERSRSGVALTPTGREVASRARQISEDVQGIVDFASNAQKDLVGTIRLGSMPTLGPYLLPHVVARLHKKHQALRLYVREAAPIELEAELLGGVHDLILEQLPVQSSELVTAPLFREPLYLAFASDHPFADQEKIRPADLRGLDVLSLGPQYHLNQQIYTLCADLGANLLRDYEGTSLDALRQMVGMGLGTAFLPALYVHSEITARSEIVVKPLQGKSISRAVGLVWRKSAGRATAYRQIADIIRDVVKKKFPDLSAE